MNERFEHFEEVHELVELLCERQANETQLARLQELVQSDKAALRFYVDYLDLHAQFLWRSQNLGATCFQSTSSLLSSEELSLSHSKLRRSSRPMAASIAPLTRKFFRASTFGWVATTLALVAVVYWSARHTSSNGLAGPSPTAPAITSIRIPSGLVSFSLDKIGTVVLEGPADFEFLSPMRARLNKGNLKMRVTEDSGHGFVVQTPDGEVTDLGTEFSLNVSDGKRTSLIVHEGEVDLRVGRTRQLNGPERLIEGEAVSFNATGEIERVMSLVLNEPEGSDELVKPSGTGIAPLITSVSDNLHSHDTKGYYQIVPAGLREDALANVDRRHEWNGVNASGIPTYLRSADYVKTFNSTKKRPRMQLSVALSRPVKLYVFCDERTPPAGWLVRDFVPTGDYIGLDANDSKTMKRPRARGTGPGQSIDLTFSVWVREIAGPGMVVLGDPSEPLTIGTYGIAAVEMKLDEIKGAVDAPIKDTNVQAGGLNTETD